MMRLPISIIRKRHDGSVAVEAALCMTFILVPLMSVVLLLGKFFWYYTAAQKAVHDAALYMAGAPLSEIKSGGASTLALEMIVEETSDFDSSTIVAPTVLCGYKNGNNNVLILASCNTIATPAIVKASIGLSIANPFFSPLSSDTQSSDTTIVWAYSQISYVGI